MSLTRQGRAFLTVGVLQWLLDWGVMVALSDAGMMMQAATILGRIAGATLGFWLNGRVTFAAEENAARSTQLRRFGVMWLATTAISTVALGAIKNLAGLHSAQLAKPCVEAMLGVVGFLGSRHWVYRR